MSITTRLYSASDRQRVIDFRRANTTLENVYDYPTVVDLYELLDTSAAHGTTRTGIWEDENGDIIALQYCNRYFLISPHISHWEHEIETSILIHLPYFQRASSCAR
jgi:hypothetical protein